MGVDAMIESLDLVKAGTAPKEVQNLDEGSYESWFGKAQVEIDWSKSASDIYNTIRAGNPQPGAWTKVDGVIVQFYDSRRIDEVAGDAGSVAGISDEGILVSAGDNGGVIVSRVRPSGEGKMSAAEYAAASGLKLGAKLGN